MVICVMVNVSRGEFWRQRSTVDGLAKNMNFWYGIEKDERIKEYIITVGGLQNFVMGPISRRVMRNGMLYLYGSVLVLQMTWQFISSNYCYEWIQPGAKNPEVILITNRMKHNSINIGVHDYEVVSKPVVNCLG